LIVVEIDSIVGAIAKKIVIDAPDGGDFFNIEVSNYCY